MFKRYACITALPAICCYAYVDGTRQHSCSICMIMVHFFMPAMSIQIANEQGTRMETAFSGTDRKFPVSFLCACVM
jgi:hypothetical protein